MSAETTRDLRRQVIRRVRFATNFIALEAKAVPPEGPFDAALTNGLLAIVALDWPGEEKRSKKGADMRSARELLDLISTSGGLAHVDGAVLREGLNLTQPFRHGRADDEFAVIHDGHVHAVRDLDDHDALRFIDTARGLSLDECTMQAFMEAVEEQLPFDPKDRLDVPEPDDCPHCWRNAFLPSGWDVFGGTRTAGFCVACGYERGDSEAYDEAVSDALSQRMHEDL